KEAGLVGRLGRVERRGLPVSEHDLHSQDRVFGFRLRRPAGAGLVSVAATSFSVTVRDTGATSWFRMIACHVAVGSATTVTLLMSSRAVHVLSSVWPPGAGVSVTVILPAGALLGSAPAGARSVGGTGAIPTLDDAIGVSPRQMTPLSA